jgi:hypothetical protein
VKKQGGDNNASIEEAYRKKKPAYYTEDLWLEHVESELERSFEEDLDLLLKNSSSDRKIVESLERTRQAIKKSDEVALPENGQYYADLHDRIMGSIDGITPESPVRASGKMSVPKAMKKTLRNAKFAWPALMGTISMSLLVASIGWFAMTAGQNRAQVESSGAVAHAEQLAEQLSEDGLTRGLASASDVVPSFSQSMVGYESESDLLAQVAVERLKGLDSEQMSQAFESLKKF